jgi:Flp pilus assembly protein TadD
MKTSAMLKLATASLIMGTTMVGCSTQGQASRPASASDAHIDRIAARAAEKARGAIAKKKFDMAIVSAEKAVSYSPRDAGYRMLLGQAYLGAGRFASAETAFSDVLTLTPDNGRAALNLALVEVARGKKDRALSTLGEYRDRISGVDYGLAMALAGETREAIRVLEALAREPGADARVRQNLALSYALDGQWAPARTMASVDLGEAEADARLLQWAAFSRPDGAAAQVATLLGVSPVASDSGLPAQLALGKSSSTVQTAMTAPAAAPAVEASAFVAQAPQPVFETVAPAASPAPAQVVTAAPVFETAAPAARPASAQVVAVAPVDVPPPVFETDGPDLSDAPVAVAARIAAPLIRASSVPARQMVVRAKPGPIAAAPRAIAAVVTKAPAVKPMPFDSGKFVVQLGAFENAAVSRDAWNRMSARFGLAGYEPANGTAKLGNTSFVRLSVGGFATHADAKRICTRIAAAGGKCFVRGLLGDQVANWVKRGPAQRFAKAPAKPAAKPIRVASR